MRGGCARVVQTFLALLGVLLLLAGLWWWTGQRRFRTWNWDWTWRDPVVAHPWEDTPRPTDVRVEIEPQEALVDRPWTTFRVTGLVPGQTVGLRAQALDSDGERWVAAGLWRADPTGTVDVVRQAPFAGTYAQADPMGLLWSMRPEREQQAPVFEPPTPAYTVDLTVEVGDAVLVRTTVVRRLWPAEVACQEVREGRMVGALCRPPGDGPFPAVLLLSGSEGGYSLEQAAQWAGHGSVAFAMAYFGVDPLPQALGRIPVEHFLEGLAWLRRQPGVDPERVFVFGPSRGSEAALLTGLHAEKPPTGIVAMMPSHVLWAGLDFSRGRPPAAWTYQGQDLPYVETGWDWELLRMFVGHPVRLRGLFEAALAGEVPEEARIPVERVGSRLLLISATDDQMWPSQEMAQALVARMEAHGRGADVQHLTLQGAGHVLRQGYLPPIRLVPPYLVGGTDREANVQGGIQAWEAMQAFVHGTGP